MNIFLLLLAILPGLIISFLIIKADRYEKESKLLMGAAFVLGALITYPTMLAEGVAADLGWEESGNFFKIFFFAVIFVGLIEEFFKFICLGIPYFRKEFNEPMDGIVYAVLIAMGFATLENVIYADRFGISTVAIRAFTAVPAHGAFAAIMGYYVGLAKFDKTQRWKLVLFGLGLAAFLHGLYDFFIIQPYAEWMMSLSTLVLVFSGYLAYRMIRILQNSSPFHPDNIEATEKDNEKIEGVVSNEKVVAKESETENAEPKKEIKSEITKEENPSIPPPPPEDIPTAYNDDVLFSAIDNVKNEEE